MKRIEELPFFYKARIRPGNGNFPETFPFDLYFDQELRMFRQKATETLLNLLQQVYRQGSLADGSISSESGTVYLKSVIDYIVKNSGADFSDSILEIGFGSGILLRDLKGKGYLNLTGIEPGGHKLVDGLEGIHLIKDFFPSKEIAKKFDLLFSFAILEHITDPVEFLRLQSEFLNPNGKIIFSVPNCTPYLNAGDPSIFIHEHFSYFTKLAILTIAQKANLTVSDLSVIEGAYIATLSKGANHSADLSREEPGETGFYREFEKHLNRIAGIIEPYSSNNICIYCPIRAMNLLYILKLKEVRFVDDSTEIQGKYLPYFTSGIESFEEMCTNPPELIIVFSRTFGDKIKLKCTQSDALGQTRIITLKDID